MSPARLPLRHQGLQNVFLSIYRYSGVTLFCCRVVEWDTLALLEALQPLAVKPSAAAPTVPSQLYKTQQLTCLQPSGGVIASVPTLVGTVAEQAATGIARPRQGTPAEAVVEARQCARGRLSMLSRYAVLPAVLNSTPDQLCMHASLLYTCNNQYTDTTTCQRQYRYPC